MPDRLHKQRVGEKVSNIPSDRADETVASGDAQGDLWDNGSGTDRRDVRRAETTRYNASRICETSREALRDHNGHRRCKGLQSSEESRWREWRDGRRQPQIMVT